jgi:hypothetical protein
MKAEYRKDQIFTWSSLEPVLGFVTSLLASSGGNLALWSPRSVHNTEIDGTQKKDAF